MKRFITLLLAIIIIMSSMTVSAFAVENEVNVTLDGYRLVFDVPGRLIEGRTMVPVRTIFESLGATVEYNGETKEVTAFRGDDTVKLTIGEPELYKNDELVYTMDVLPVIIEENGESRTLVPARAVSEALGAVVDWEAETRTAIITNVTDDTVMMIGDFPVDYDTYAYYCNSLILSYLPDPAILEADPALTESFKALVLETIINDYSINDLAVTVGYTPYDPAFAEAVDSALATYISQYGDAFETVLSESYMTPDVFKNLLVSTTFNTAMLNSFYAEASTLSAEEQVKMLMESETLVRAAHILVEDITVAEGLLEEAQNASDEEFVRLATEIGTDPGMAGNADGYYFTPGQMVESFENAVYSLNENETSGIVESDYGYHIIRRLPKDEEYVLANTADILQGYITSEYYLSVIANAQVLASELSLLEKYNEIDIIEDFIKPFYETIELTEDEISGNDKDENSDSETIDEVIVDGDSYTEENPESNNDAEDTVESDYDKFKKLI
ncbi:MAG: peptidylprolyl isomerase [Clostridia bacterium]|nr:peptidylprolyl isomerase [Clostridia bacterium]